MLPQDFRSQYSDRSIIRHRATVRVLTEGSHHPLRLTLMGVGAMNSPCYAPAGLLVQYRRNRVMIDGGGAAEPKGKLNAWLVSDLKNELMAEIRIQARAHGVEPQVGTYGAGGLLIVPKPVVHTSHPTYGYFITVDGLKIVWAPEFFMFPGWARQADLMFAEAAGWNRPIRFVGGVGGHASALKVAAEAQAHGIKQLVLAHIGRPTIRAMKAGESLPFGRFGRDKQVFLLHPRSDRTA